MVLLQIKFNTIISSSFEIWQWIGGSLFLPFKVPLSYQQEQYIYIIINYINYTINLLCFKVNINILNTY